MTTTSDPPFYRYAAKFLAALAAAVVGTSATILAAVDDGHVSGKEWAAIVLGVLALLAGPAAVFGVANAARGPKLPADFVASAVFRRHVDGTVDLKWPEGRGTTWITPDALEGIVKTHNDLVRQVPAAVDGSAAAQRAYPAPAWNPPA